MKDIRELESIKRLKLMYPDDPMLNMHVCPKDFIKQDANDCHKNDKKHNPMDKAKRYFTYHYFRQKPNTQIERLYAQKGLPYERLMYQNLKLDQKDNNNKKKLKVEEFQDEAAMKLMQNSQHLYLTEEDIKKQNEQNKKDQAIVQKRKLQKLINLQARQVHGELHQKTHFKAATQILYGEFKPNSKNEVQTDMIKNLVHKHNERMMSRRNLLS